MYNAVKQTIKDVKNMKRFFVLFLAVILAVTSFLTACSNSEEEETAMLRGTAATDYEATPEELDAMRAEMVAMYDEVVRLCEENGDVLEYWYYYSEDAEFMASTFMSTLESNISSFDFNLWYYPEPFGANEAIRIYDRHTASYNKFIEESADFASAYRNKIDEYAKLTDEEKRQLEYEGGTIYFSNEAGYTVRFSVKYRSFDDDRVHYLTTDRILLGQDDSFTIPEKSYNIEVSCEAWNGTKWKDPFFCEVYDMVPDGYTFRTYGALPKCKMEVIKG